ncbi:hypothetical protein BDK51DRAFT_27660 [Blyttiomyces helicus]|uniref:Uncharacterized protein n=1 Tax=Blyttiomyces helicus TaxID=388810 RepID=A0A4P9W2Z9_9FUNG|nr:hypothetical protein BDK51DRAFT_27660 [Blyttiomyces helicus]|eukprot:RKO86641.1 hypothetical protein BDK51DRAFT_27660 [Blyttiomyces helicus]
MANAAQTSRRSSWCCVSTQFLAKEMPEFGALNISEGSQMPVAKVALAICALERGGAAHPVRQTLPQSKPRLFGSIFAPLICHTDAFLAAVAADLDTADHGPLTVHRHDNFYTNRGLAVFTEALYNRFGPLVQRCAVLEVFRRDRTFVVSTPKTQKPW